MKLIHGDFYKEIDSIKDVSLIIADIPYDDRYRYGLMFDKFKFNNCIVIIVDNVLSAFSKFMQQSLERWTWFYHGIWLHDDTFTHLLGFVNKNDERGFPCSSIVKYRNWHITDHPEERPIELMEYIIQNFSLGGLVLDPFMGSGSSYIAAKNSGNDYIGIEVNETFYNMAVKRGRA